MEKVTFSLELTNKILGYLGTRPFAEVSHLIIAAQAEYELQQPKAEPVLAVVADAPEKEEANP